MRDSGEPAASDRGRGSLVMGGLPASEATLAALLEGAPDGVIIMDPAGRIVYVNSQTEQIFGYDRNELLGEGIEKLVPERYRELHVAQRLGYMAQPRTRPMGVGLDLYGLRKDGTEVPVEISLSPVPTGQGLLVNAVVRNISERKRMEDALRESEERFRRLVDSVRDYAIYMLDADGNVASWNPGSARIHGYAADEVIGRPVACFYTEEDVRRGKPERDLRMAAENGQFEEETCRVRKDGSRFWAGTTLTAIRDEQGRLQGFSKVTRDITARKHAEEKIQALNAQLERRVAELDAVNRELEAFSYSVSHDLRAPLRSIDGFSQALVEDYGDKLEGQAKDYLERVRAAAQRMAQLIDDLLKLSRVTRGEMHLEQVDLSGMALAVAAELQQSQPDRQAEWSIADGLRVEADPRLLRLVLENLLGNAWKFTAGRQPARIELGVTERNGRRAFFVRDNGAGFDMAYVDKLFRPFQRLHAMTEFPGTGIGLATVQRIINRHGGQVWAEGEPGKGATFTFTL